MHFLEITSDESMNIVDMVVIAPLDVFYAAIGAADTTLQNKTITVISEFERMGGNKSENDYLTLDQSWGINASDGDVLKSFAPTTFTGTLMLPKHGDYIMYIRTDGFWAISDLKVNETFISIDKSDQDEKIKVIEDFDSIANWTVVNTQASLSDRHVKTGNYSLNFSFAIDKSENPIHRIYKDLHSVDLTDYKAVGFWVYPETQTSHPTSEVFLHLRNSAGEWYGSKTGNFTVTSSTNVTTTGINLYVKNNEWNYVSLNLSDWKERNTVNLVRFTVGDSWGTYDDQQQVNLYIDDLRAYGAKNNDLQWYSISNLYMEQGINSIQFSINAPHVSFDLLVLEHLNVQNNGVNDFSSVKLTFERINPTKYRVTVKNATQPFCLAFSESYHPQWKAYINEKSDDTHWIEAFYQKPISDNKHFLLNGYANAWYINPNRIDKDGDGEFIITLYFWPQSLSYLGAIILLTTFVLCILHLIKSKVKEFYHNRRSLREESGALMKNEQPKNSSESSVREK